MPNINYMSDDRLDYLKSYGETDAVLSKLIEIRRNLYKRISVVLPPDGQRALDELELLENEIRKLYMNKEYYAGYGACLSLISKVSSSDK